MKGQEVILRYHLSFRNKKHLGRCQLYSYSSTRTFLNTRIDIDYPMVTEDAGFPLYLAPRRGLRRNRLSRYSGISRTQPRISSGSGLQALWFLRYLQYIATTKILSSVIYWQTH